MKIKRDPLLVIFRTILIAFMVFSTPLSLLAMHLDTKDMAQGDIWLIPVMVVLLWIVTVMVAVRSAAIELTPKGVCFRPFFVEHFCPWEKIKLVGVVSKQTLMEDYQEITLLLPGGFGPGEDSALYQIRNVGRLLYMPYTKATRDYVTEHYGKMDF